MQRSLIINIILSLSNLFFLLLYGILCLHNRLAIDDFHFLSNVRQFGVVGGTIEEYHSWSSRWVSVFVNHGVLFFHERTPISLFAFGIFNLLLFISVVFLFLKYLVKIPRDFHVGLIQEKGKEKVIRNWLLLNLSIFLVSIIFIATIRINETWFWLCSSTTYLWSNIMFLLGITSLFVKNRKAVFNFLAYFSFFYIGGSSGPLAIVSLLVLFVILALTRSKIIFFGTNQDLIFKRASISFIFCLGAFLVLFFAHGNEVREQFFDSISIGESFILNIKMVGIIVIKRLPLILPFIAILCLPMIAFGHYDKRSKPQSQWKQKLVWLVVFYFFMIFIFQLPITYKTQDVAAFRALLFVTTLTVFFFLFGYYIVGRNTTLSMRWYRFFMTIPFMVSLLLFTYEFFQQHSITSRYSQAYDQRMIYIKRNQQRFKVLELDPLPFSGMLLSAELSEDTSHFSNQHLKKALGLSFNVKKGEDD